MRDEMMLDFSEAIAKARKFEKEESSEYRKIRIRKMKADQKETIEAMRRGLRNGLRKAKKKREERMNDQMAFRIVKLIADSCFDGHFTLFKFTTEWRMCFGTVDLPLSCEGLGEMSQGKTLMEAFVNSLEGAEFPENSRRPVREAK